MVQAAACKIVPEYVPCITVAEVYVRLKVTHKTFPESC